MILSRSAIVVKSKFLGGIFVLSRCFSDFAVGVGVFVIRLSQISSFFSDKDHITYQSVRNRC